MSLADVLEFAACTDTGLVRPQNEDSLAFDAGNGFALLADGMGGYNAGEVASQLAVTAVAEGLKAVLPTMRATRHSVTDVALQLRQQIALANAKILQQSLAQPQWAGMGTTLVALVFHDRRAVVAHVGDSRLYRLRGVQFEQLTHDHSVLQECIDQGQVSPDPDVRLAQKSLLTRALGVESGVEAELNGFEVLPGDLFLLCSDGLPDMLEDSEIGQVLATRKSDLTGAAQRLVEMANDHGGFDNVSVIVVRVKQSFPRQG